MRYTTMKENHERRSDMYLISKGYISDIKGDGTGLAYLCACSTIQVVSLKQKKVIKRIGKGQNCTFIALNQQGTQIAVADIPEKIDIYDIATEKKIFSVYLSKFHVDIITELYFTPDGNYVVGGDSNGNIYLIDWKNNELQILKKFSYAIQSIQYDMNKNFIFCIAFTGILQWQYPFNENVPRFISNEFILSINNNIDVDFFQINSALLVKRTYI